MKELKGLTQDATNFLHDIDCLIEYHLTGKIDPQS